MNNARVERMDSYFDDDGHPMDPDILPKPSLCISCRHDDNPDQEALCMLNRMDQQGEAEFRCDAYVEKG